MSHTVYRPGIVIAPPRFPCTECRMSHGGCALNYVSQQDVCCDECNHQQEGS